MTPTLKGWCAKYDFQCLCLPIPFLLIASITDLYDDSDYRCLFSLSFYVKDLWLAINGFKATGRSRARDRYSGDCCIRASLPSFIVIRSLGFFSIVRILIRLKGGGWNTKNNSHRSTGRDTRRKACRTRTPMRQSPWDYPSHNLQIRFRIILFNIGFPLSNPLFKSSPESDSFRWRLAWKWT